MKCLNFVGLRGDTEYLVRVIGATSLGWPELNEFQAPFYKITTPSDKLTQLESPSVQLYSVNSTLIEVRRDWVTEFWNKFYCVHLAIFIVVHMIDCLNQHLLSIVLNLLQVLWKYDNDSSIDGFKITYSNSIDIDDIKTFSVSPFERSCFIPYKGRDLFQISMYT